MVKVQKPTPKTLGKAANMEKSKKKSADKVEKPRKIKDVVDIAGSKKKLLKETVKEEKMVATAKKDKKVTQGAPMKKQKNEQVKEKPTEKKHKLKQEPPKRPLVLAPPESPTPMAPAKAKPKKEKKQKVAAPLAAAAETAPQATKKPKRKQKKFSKPSGGAVQKPQEPMSKLQKKKLAKRAYKRQQIKNKRTGVVKKVKPQPTTVFEPVPFDEETFKGIVNVANIKKIAKALKTQVETEVNEKKTSIFSDFRYFLNVASFKIPHCPKRMVKLNLKHSLVDKDDDVLIIVKDMQRGAKVDYEPTIEHYENLFRDAGVEGLKIMPFNQLRKEYGTFESVRKLGNTYDYFLCDGRLVGQVAGFCGKIFQKPRTTFHAVRMENTKNLKNEITKSLNRTAYKQLEVGDLISIPVGNHKYTMQQLAENVEHVIEQLKNIYPGGLGNVRSLYLKIDITGTTSLPIYMSTGQAPAQTPNVIGPKEQRMLKLKKDANEVLTKFAMTKDANMVKLNKTQVELKRKFKEAKALLLADENKKGPKKQKGGDDDTVPAKKARKDTKEEEKDKKKAKPEEEEEDDSDDVANDDSDDAEEDGGDGDDDDEEEDDEGDDDDGESDDDDEDDGDEEDDDEESN